MLIATAVVKGESRFMTSMLIKNAKAVANEANNASHNQSSFGMAQNANDCPLPSNQNNTAKTAAALINSTRVRLAESYERTKTELNVEKTAARGRRNQRQSNAAIILLRSQGKVPFGRTP